MPACRFGDLVRTHSGAVNAFARARTADPWLAEEAAQITFVRAWQYQASYRQEGSYEAWLLRICRNVITDLVTNRLHEETIDDAADHSMIIDDGVPSSTEFDAALAEVPVTLRGALTLCGVLGYDYASAAEMLDVPVGTVRSRVHRGRAALGSALELQPCASA